MRGALNKAHFPSGGVDGVTITGGEPFEHPDGLAELLRGLHAWRADLERPVDILCYSGLRYSLEAGGDARQRVQAEIEEAGVLYVGIPQREDMERLEEAVRARSLIIGDVSWRA
jgi:hypothetical protein